MGAMSQVRLYKDLGAQVYSSWGALAMLKCGQKLRCWQYRRPRWQASASSAIPTDIRVATRLLRERTRNYKESLCHDWYRRVSVVYSSV